jgi:hypothetical protein
MATAFSSTLRNARLDQITTTVGASCLIRIYDGTRPATGGTATNLLAQLTGNATFAPSASGGVLTLNAITQDSSADVLESSEWINATAFTSGSKTAVQTGSGNAYGTMVSHTAPAFEDSAAHLAGIWPADHEVTVTLSNSAAPDGLEAEILLRADFTGAHAVCYEVDCYKAGGGIALVRWDNTTGSPESFTVLRNYVASEVALANGDQVRARIQGTLITVWYRTARAVGARRCSPTTRQVTGRSTPAATPASVSGTRPAWSAINRNSLGLTFWRLGYERRRTRLSRLWRGHRLAHDRQRYDDQRQHGHPACRGQQRDLRCHAGSGFEVEHLDPG